MPLNFSTALRNARAQAIIAAIDTGTANGTLKFYSGTKPATGVAITDQTLLGTATFSKPCGAVVNGVLTFEPIASDPVADATGTITWARALNGDNAFVFDMDCGASGGSSVVSFNNVSVEAGGIIMINSGALTEGNA
jgi:hypothetical protein